MTSCPHDYLGLSKRGVTRRRFLHTVSASAAAAGTLSFRDLMALQAAELRKQGRALILLWMGGGPSQFETFDPKPGTENGGPTEAIDTAIPGVQFAAGWENMAAVADEITLIRSMTNKEGNHQRATYQLHTGYVPSGSIKHPMLGASIAKEIGPDDLELPSVVSVGPGGLASGGLGAGFLGVDYEPFAVADPARMPENLQSGVASNRYNRRLGLLGRMEGEFAARGAESVVDSHRRLYGKASRMVLSPATSAFDISQDEPKLAAEYGDSAFGRGCLLARRLVESGVTFVEVRSNGWDTHAENFDRVGELAGQVDPASAALIRDLKQRGMLDRTMVVWMGEFGRTPRVNPRNGRDHFPRVFSGWMAGAGIRGGQVIGASSRDGSEVADNPIGVGDLLTSICHGLNVDPTIENMSPLGRPMRIVDQGTVIDGLFG